MENNRLYRFFSEVLDWLSERNFYVLLINILLTDWNIYRIAFNIMVIQLLRQ